MLPETVGSAEIRITDPLYRKQREDVAKMRASLLACSDDPITATAALQNITVLRVYHQVSRIIRYLEMMDKIEDKLYESIDYRLDHMDSNSPTAWMTLITIQEKLLKNMTESHKLLQPYLNVEEFSLQSLMPVSSSNAVESGAAAVLPKSSRDKLRQSAQQVLAVLSEVESDDSDEDAQTLAASVLESLNLPEVGGSND